MPRYCQWLKLLATPICRGFRMTLQDLGGGVIGLIVAVAADVQGFLVPQARVQLDSALHRTTVQLGCKGFVLASHDQPRPEPPAAKGGSGATNSWIGVDFVYAS